MAFAFPDRREAGRRLAPLVAALGLADPVVLGLPRGGVPVAAEVATALGAPLDAYVARKVGAPFQPELGVGAIAEGGEPVFDDRTLRALRLDPRDLAATVTRERAELGRRVARYRGDRPLTPVRGRDVVLVDDGLATGVTAHAALLGLRGLGPRTLVLAVPVAAPEAAHRLRDETDHLVCLLAPPGFAAVGRFYADFSATTDAAVVRLLTTPPAAGRPRRPGGPG